MNTSQKFAKYVTSSVLGMVGLSCYILADTYFVSAGVGGLGLAALNIAIPIFSLISGTGLMAGIGAASRFTALRAAKDKNAENIFTNICAFGMAAGVLITLLGFVFSEEICLLLGADTETLAYTDEYLKTLMCTSLLFIMNNILTAFVRNDGNPRLSMAAMLIGSFANILLDYLFIFPLGLGMFGAAAATASAPIISMLILSLHFLKKSNTFRLMKCRISPRAIASCLSMGIFSFVTELSSGIVMVFFNRSVFSLAGNTGVAAYGIIANVALVAVSIFTGISQGIQPLVSVSAAEKNKPELSKILRLACVLSLAVAGILFAAAYFFREPTVALFNKEKDAEMTALACRGLVLYFTGFFAAGLNIIAAAFCAACTKTKESFLISMMRGVIFILPAILILSHTAGTDGIWLSFGTAEALTLVFSAVTTVRYFRKFAKSAKSS